MKPSHILLSALLPAITLSAQNHLPPVFDNDTQCRRDEITTTYIAPRKVLWVSSDTLVTNHTILTDLASGQPDIAGAPFCLMRGSTPADTASIILDFGHEINGHLRLTLGHCDNPAPAKIRIRFGESVAETCTEPDGGHNTPGLASNDHAMRDFIMEIPRYGRAETGNSGFRFARIDLLSPDHDIQIKEAAAGLRCRDIPYLGSFRSSDSRLDSIWLTGAYTVHLNMQDYLWDGIKRDRLVWLGDMHPEVSTITTVFGSNDIVPASLDISCAMYPLPRWINDISTYSLWYLIIQHDWFMHGGDMEFLNRHKDYILGLIDIISAKVEPDGTEHIEEGTANQLKRFLDWPSSPDRAGVEAGYRAMVAWAMTSAEKLCDILGEKESAAKAAETVRRIKQKTLPHNGLKQAAALMAVSGLADPKEMTDEVVAVRGAEGFSTFYGLYMLEAMALAGEYEAAMQIIRDYWGGMLDLGATTFWEDFNIRWLDNAARIDNFVPAGKTDVHGAYGDYCYLSYRHSLCHGWASGPTAWLTRHILGIQPLEPGCAVVSVTPHLGNLEWAEGTYPTPKGVIKVRHEKQSDGTIKTICDAPAGVKVILPEA